MELRQRIVASYPELSPHLQAIAQFALAHPDAMAVERLNQLAAMIGVQPSSIVRFAQILGFRGVKAMRRPFQEQFRYYAAIRPGADTDKADAPADDGGGVGAVLDEAEREIEMLRRTTRPALLDEAAGLLAAADQIHVVAQQQSFAIAHLIAWSFLAMGRQAHILDNVGGIALRQSELATARDATIAISLPPYDPSVVAAARTHAEAGGRVIALTDTPLSPLAAPATVLLETPQADGGPIRTMAAPLCMAKMLVEAFRRRLTRPDEGPDEGTSIDEGEFRAGREPR